MLDSARGLRRPAGLQQQSCRTLLSELVAGVSLKALGTRRLRELLSSGRSDPQSLKLILDAVIAQRPRKNWPHIRVNPSRTL